tara:strand:+ start:1849 stop:2340 length:492 start_codon:yes stop_codon:yes gene_type:complete
MLKRDKQWSRAVANAKRAVRKLEDARRDFLADGLIGETVGQEVRNVHGQREGEERKIWSVKDGEALLDSSPVLSSYGKAATDQIASALDDIDFIDFSVQSERENIQSITSRHREVASGQSDPGPTIGEIDHNPAYAAQEKLYHDAGRPRERVPEFFPLYLALG